MLVNACERILHLIEPHHLAGALVVAGTAHRATAVIPDDEDAMVRFKVILSEAQEIREGVRARHVRIGQRRELPQAIFVEDETVYFPCLRLIVMPLPGTARLNHEGHAIGWLQLRQFHEVRSARTGFRLQVRATHIELDDPLARRRLTRPRKVAARGALTFAAVKQHQEQAQAAGDSQNSPQS